MKVGTDGVLLGAWADLTAARRILDIGTGTGVMALMAAQRNPMAAVDAVEINPDAYGEAEENFAASPWADRLRVFCVSVFDYKSEGLYESIICNPPFFGGSTPAPDRARAVARHGEGFSFPDLLQTVHRLLAPGGCFSVVLPAEIEGRFVEMAASKSLYATRVTAVRPTPSKPAKRVLMAFSAQECGNAERSELVIETSPLVYTDDYRRLTRDFYLAM